jgi:release factor glutamine methyltransferase
VTGDYPSTVEALRKAGCVFAEDEARLLIDAAATPEDLADLVDQRVKGLPLEQILGWAEFCGRRILVEPGVFVPRRRTELLVYEVVALAPAGAVIVDMCCGSGAVGAALLARLDGIDLHAADVDPAAVRCATRNIGAQVYQGDLFDALPTALRGRVDVLVANVPYVPSDAVATMPPEARSYEPRTALDGGVDGLDLARRLVGEARDWLAPGASVLFEASESQLPAAVDIVVGHGFRSRVARSEELDAAAVIATVLAPQPNQPSRLST